MDRARPLLTLGIVGLFAATHALAICTEDVYEPDDGCVLSEATIRGGEAQQHQFCENSVDWIGFHAVPGRSYTLETLNLLALTDTVIELYASDCSTLLVADDNGAGGLASRISWTAPSEGVFHLRIRESTPSFGDNHGYTVAVTGDTRASERWSRTYASATGNNALVFAFEQAHDGGFAVAGSTFGPTYPYNADSWFLRTDSQGNVVWHKSYEGPLSEENPRIAELPDGGWVLAETIVNRETFETKGIVMRLAPSGQILWQTTFGSTEDSLQDVDVAADGTILVGGSTYPTAASSAAYVVKLDANGALLWSKRYGGSSSEFLNSIVATPDGGSIFSGTLDTDEVWIVKLSPAGAIVWQKRYGQSGRTTRAGLIRTTDGGLALAGRTDEDAWLAKLDGDGNLVWERFFHGTISSEFASSIREMPGGGFLVSEDRMWLAKLAPDGNLEWSLRYAGNGLGQHASALATADGGIAVAGGAFDGTGTVSMLRLDAGGDVCWCADLSPILLATPTAGTVVATISVHTRDYTPATAAGDLVSNDRAVGIETRCRCLGQPYKGLLQVGKNGAGALVQWSQDASAPYDLVRGDLGTLRLTHGDFTAALDALPVNEVCLGNDVTTLELEDDLVLPAGAGFFYLLRGAWPTCDGYDSGAPSQIATRDPGIAQAAGACP